MHISILPAMGFERINQVASEGKTKHSNLERNRSQAHLWTNIEYQNLENYKKTFFCLFCLWDSPDYYICIYDWPGWHPIPQSSLLTYSSTPLFRTCLLLISEIPVHAHYAYSFAQSKSNGFCPKEINFNTFLTSKMFSAKLYFITLLEFQFCL